MLVTPTHVKSTMFQNNLRQMLFKNHRRLFLDLDGVFADYDAHYHKQFGHHCGSVPDDVMWANVHSLPQFFYDLPLMPGAADFFTEVQHLNPIFITACPEENYANIARYKRLWVRELLSPTALVLPMRHGSKKYLFADPGDILIDDFHANTTPWQIAGGVGILHTEFDQTRRELIAALI